MKRLLLAALAAVPVAAAAITPLWLRDAQISPDGKQIAFTYMGDVWTVPAQGGAAKRITSLPSYESNPIWSPDSKKIAFASDRHGNADIFLVDAQGGTPMRLERPLPVPDNYRSACPQPAIGMSTGSPIEELEKGP